MVQDNRAINTQVSRLFTLLTPLIVDLFKELAHDFSATLDNWWRKKQLNTAKLQEGFNSRIKLLEEENAQLKRDVDEGERFSRMDNLIIYGLPHSSFAEVPSGESVPKFSPSSSNQETQMCDGTMQQSSRHKGGGGSSQTAMWDQGKTYD